MTDNGHEAAPEGADTTPAPADEASGAKRPAAEAKPSRTPPLRATPDAVRRQMLRALAHQVRGIDLRLMADGAEVAERDSRILGNLAKTLATLVEIGEGGTGTKDNPKQREPTDRGDAELRLARKIEAWAGGGA